MTLTPRHPLIEALEAITYRDKLSDRALARRLGVNASTVWRWWKVTQQPSMRQVRRMIAEFPELRGVAREWAEGEA